MDRDEKRRKGRYANGGEVSQADEPIFDTPIGREVIDGGSDYEEHVHRKEVGVVPRSTVTGSHQSGTGAQENEDGLSGSEEEVRHMAEDIGSGEGREDTREMPVFDRGETPPKV